MPHIEHAFARHTLANPHSHITGFSDPEQQVPTLVGSSSLQNSNFAVCNNEFTVIRSRRFKNRCKYSSGDNWADFEFTTMHVARNKGKTRLI